jgi:ribosome-associated protein
MQRTQDRTEEERIARATRVARAAFEMKAERLVALDVRALTSYADTFVLMTGRSDRHVRAIADSIIESFKAEGEKPLGVEGHDEGRWILIDLGDVIAHVFQSDVREEYDLERLWSDAPPLAIADPAA